MPTNEMELLEREFEVLKWELLDAQDEIAELKKKLKNCKCQSGGKCPKKK